MDEPYKEFISGRLGNFSELGELSIPEIEERLKQFKERGFAWMDAHSYHCLVQIPPHTNWNNDYEIISRVYTDSLIKHKSKFKGLSCQEIAEEVRKLISAEDLEAIRFIAILNNRKNHYTESNMLTLESCLP